MIESDEKEAHVPLPEGISPVKITVAVNKNKSHGGDVSMPEEEDLTKGKILYWLIVAVCLGLFVLTFFAVADLIADIDKSGGFGEALGNFIGDIQQGISESKEGTQ